MTDNTKGADLVEKFKGHLYLWHENIRQIPNKAVFNIIKEIEQAAFERGRIAEAKACDEHCQRERKEGFLACREKAAAVATGPLPMPNEHVQCVIDTGKNIARVIEKLTPDGGIEK